MKKLLKLFLLGVVFTACNPSNADNQETAKNSTTQTDTDRKMDYAYTIDHPDNWESGPKQNTANVLKALKAWENKNIDESLSYFADSVHVRFDNMDGKVSKDSLKTLITPSKNTKNIRIKMEDWESVISKDKKTEYVTLWYKEYTERTKGDIDSIDIVNDLKMKDGKIIGLDQYTRKLPK